MREATDSVVSVRDYGAGIARAMLDRVFELFLQLRAAMAARVRPRHRALSGGKAGYAVRGSTEARSESEGHGSAFIVR